ncbi:MAG: hypothetical protein VW552_07625, partial [Ilumatobacter sp.]
MARRLALIGALTLLAGCASGPRPTLIDAPVVADPAALEVLRLLEQADQAEFTASYLIVTKFGGATTPAVVTQQGNRRSVTIGHIRYLTEGSRT